MGDKSAKKAPPNGDKPVPAGDTTRTKRAKSYLERLKESGGQRYVIDLDAAGVAAVSQLISAGYGGTNKVVFERSILEAATNYKSGKK